VATLLRSEVAPDDATLTRLDRRRPAFEDRDVVVGRPGDEADDRAEAALRLREQQQVAGRCRRELRERRFLRGVQG
jgi:hypothetical protein